MYTIKIQVGKTLRVLMNIGLAAVMMCWVAGVTEVGHCHPLQTKDGRDNHHASKTLEEFRWHGQITPGQSIEIKGVNGSVYAEATSGNDVEVVAIKRGHHSNPREVKIQVVDHGQGVTVCAVYPSSNPDRPNECQPGKGGRMNVRDNDVEVNFTVRVPSEVNFIGRTVNGSIETKTRKGDAEAYTTNGSVRISAGENTQARTVNGSITASLASGKGTKPLDFETVNGEITVELPDESGFKFQAETVNGDISTDFPLTIQGRFSRRRISGTIGKGGRELTLKTVNGSIKLHRAL